MFDISTLTRAGLPSPQVPWQGFPRYNFIGGHNDADHTPIDVLIASLSDRLRREGRDLATYNLRTGPQGYAPLREFIAAKLNTRAHISLTADNVLVTSGSTQALALVNELFLASGDTVLIEEACYAGTMARFQRLGVRYVGVPIDEGGMCMEGLRHALSDLARQGVTPKYIYTIPTVQNPTGSVMSLDRRHKLLALAAEFNTAIFEDDCYADLIWEGERPPAIKALDNDGRVIYCGTFSKSIAPALRVGYIVADWPLMGQILALKNDAGSGALEQMALADWTVEKFTAHVNALQQTLKAKCSAMMNAVSREFGTAAEFYVPKGGIFLWVTLPDAVDTSQLAIAAAKEGVALNPGADWTAVSKRNRHRLRICFAHPSLADIDAGVAKLAEICHREFGVPLRSANVAR